MSKHKNKESLKNLKNNEVLKKIDSIAKELSIILNVSNELASKIDTLNSLFINTLVPIKKILVQEKEFDEKSNFSKNKKSLNLINQKRQRQNLKLSSRKKDVKSRTSSQGTLDSHFKKITMASNEYNPTQSNESSITMMTRSKKKQIDLDKNKNNDNKPSNINKFKVKNIPELKKKDNSEEKISVTKDKNSKYISNTFDYINFPQVENVNGFIKTKKDKSHNTYNINNSVVNILEGESQWINPKAFKEVKHEGVLDSMIEDTIVTKSVDKNEKKKDLIDIYDEINQLNEYSNNNYEGYVITDEESENNKNYNKELKLNEKNNEEKLETSFNKKPKKTGKGFI